jgi:hypothetical protein
MGLSFPKQVQRAPVVRVRYVVTCKWLDGNGLLAPDLTDTRTFYARNEAEAYAASMAGVERGSFECYVAVVSTEYTRAS